MTISPIRQTMKDDQYLRGKLANINAGGPRRFAHNGHSGGARAAGPAALPRRRTLPGRRRSVSNRMVRRPDKPEPGGIVGGAQINMIEQSKMIEHQR
jgi:hypothetical protein